MRSRISRSFLLFIVLPAMFVAMPMVRGYAQDKEKVYKEHKEVLKEHKEFKEVAKYKEF